MINKNDLDELDLVLSLKKENIRIGKLNQSWLVDLKEKQTKSKIVKNRKNGNK